jgi:hypothetical protein
MIQLFGRIATAALTIGLLLAAASNTVQAQSTIGERCSAMKIRAAARNARAQLDCAARATKDLEFDQDLCEERAAGVLRKAFAMAEAAAVKAGGTCGTIGDADDIELDAAEFCALIVSELPTE